MRERLTPRGLWRRSGVRFPLVPVLCFSPSPFSSSFSLLLSSFLSFSSPRFPLVPVLCFWFGFCVCVFGGGGLWCVVCCVGVVCVWLGCGLWCLTWAWSGWVVPCWVRSGYVCVWLFALLCAFPFCVVLVGSSESDRQKDARRRHTRSERVANTEREDHAFIHAAWACARCTPIYSRRSTLPTRTLRFAAAQGVAL